MRAKRLGERNCDKYLGHIRGADEQAMKRPWFTSKAFEVHLAGVRVGGFFVHGYI